MLRVITTVTCVLLRVCSSTCFTFRCYASYENSPLSLEPYPHRRRIIRTRSSIEVQLNKDTIISSLTIHTAAAFSTAKRKGKQRDITPVTLQLDMSLTHSHTPFKFSFHNVTLPSPQLTARMFPARDHETRQTTSGNLPGVAVAPAGAVPDAEGSRAVFTHGEVGVSLVQISTVLSYHIMIRIPVSVNRSVFNVRWDRQLRTRL